MEIRLGHECTGKTKKEFDHIINTQEKRKIFLLYDPYFVVGDVLNWSILAIDLQWTIYKKRGKRTPII